MQFEVCKGTPTLAFETTAEIILARRLVGSSLGENAAITQELAGMMENSIILDAVPINEILVGDACHMVFNALHDRVKLKDGSWEQAQAAHMLHTATIPAATTKF